MEGPNTPPPQPVNNAGELLVFAGVMVLGQFSPGPDMILLTRTALALGGRAGAWTAAGIATGLAVHATLAIGGTAALLAPGSPLAAVARPLAAAYLGWLGFGLLRAAWRPAPAGTAPVAAAGRRTAAWRRGLLCNLLNPKVVLFLAAAAASFLTGPRPPWWPAALWAVIVGQGLVLWVAWAWLLQAPPARAAYQRGARWIDAGFGVALWLLAARLLLA